MNTETKVYIEEIGDYGIRFLKPIKKYKWTGRWKIETIDRSTTMYVERWATLFRIPLFRMWVDEREFVILEESVAIFDCNGTDIE